MNALEHRIGGLRASRLERPFKIGNRVINPSKSSRRLAKVLYRYERQLARIKKLEARRADAAFNMANRRARATVLSRNRTERNAVLRVRSMDQVGYIYMPGTIYQTRNSAYQPGRITVGGQYTARVGIRKNIQDYKPVARLNPPRNSTTIRSFRVSSSSASIKVTPAAYYYQTGYLPSCPWGADGLAIFGVSDNINIPIGFSIAEASKALQKCMAKVNEADIQGGEYFFELKQFLGLLGDPMKTTLRLFKLLDRWTRRDAWIYIPQRTYRRCGKGLLVSKQPTGGVLMSMRTRRTLDPSEVSNQMFSAAANRWLQYRYGIAPAVADLATAMEWHTRNCVSQRSWNRSETARQTVQKSSTDMEYIVTRQDFQMTYQVRRTQGETYTAKLWYRVKFEPSSWFKMGLHYTQWPMVLWNALPYSFVADWVVDVNQWLVAMQKPPWIEVGPNVVTKKEYTKVVARCKKVVPIWCGTDYKLEVTPGLPIATKIREAIRRELDLPVATYLVLSKKWQSFKNLATACALIYEPLNKRS